MAIYFQCLKTNWTGLQDLLWIGNKYDTILSPNIEIHLSEPNPSWEGKRRQNLPHPLSTTPPPPFSTPPVQCARTCGCVKRGCYCFTCVCVLTSVVCVWFGPTSPLLFHNPHRVGPQEFSLRVLAYACVWDVLYFSFPNACVCWWARGCGAHGTTLWQLAKSRALTLQILVCLLDE